MCNTASDINEHLPTLFRYAKQCNSAIELGVRGCISSWAIAAGLLENKNGVRKRTRASAKSASLSMQLNRRILTYGQIKRELEKFETVCNKYIIMHDTTVDEIDGETVREYDYNYQHAYGRATELAAQTGIPREEILKGMWFGIQEFLAAHPEWYIKDRYFNNNGLMIF